MNIRHFLSMWVDNISIKVYQMLTTDKGSLLRYRQSGPIDILLNGDADYLDFDIFNLQMDDGMILIVCKEREEHVDWNKKIIEGDVTEEMLRDCFTQNNWETVILRYKDGTDISISADVTHPHNVRAEWSVDEYTIDWNGGRYHASASSLAEVAQICNDHTSIEASQDEQKEKLHAYFNMYIKGGRYTDEEWEWYSDWHKEVFGHRPNGIAFG